MFKGSSYNDLASKGRNGDTEIRKVDNKPAHVNTFEAYLLDNYGDIGEGIVKAIGSGNTNPETGLKEYDPPNLTHPAHHWTLTDNPVYNTFDVLTGGVLPGGSDPFWEWDWDNNPISNTMADLGFSSPFQQFADEQDLPAELQGQARSILGTGMEDLLKQGKRVLGTGGELEKEYEFKEDDLRRGVRTGLGKLKEQKGSLLESTGFARSGAVQSLFKDTREDLMTQFGEGMERFDFQKMQAKGSLLDQLKKAKTQLLMDYTMATGEPVEGHPQEDLEDWLETI